MLFERQQVWMDTSESAETALARKFRQVTHTEKAVMDALWQSPPTRSSGKGQTVAL